MTRRSLLIAAMTSIAITVARSGHELPVYPSYYPHEIEITTVAPERAADLLRDGKMHAYVGGTPRFAGAIPETITAVEFARLVRDCSCQSGIAASEGRGVHLCAHAGP